MVGFGSLWLPILASAVIVFLASSVIHMALKWHKKDFTALPDEAGVMAALRKAGVTQTEYYFPYAADMKQLQEPEVKKRFEDGPVGMMTILPDGLPNMGKALGLWFVYTVVISFLVAYVARVAVAPGADYLHVFRIAGTIAFLAYAGAEPVATIWRGRSTGATFRAVVDGLIYGLLTGGVFGWLWPS